MTRRAAAATELACVLPFLALVFAGAVDLARALRATQVLQTAASAGAHYASGTAWVPWGVDPADAARAVAVSECAGLYPPPGPERVQVTTGGGFVTVSVSYDLPLATGFLFPSGTVPLSRTVTVRVAPQPGD